MKIAILHRYPPKQVIGTNASFLEFLRELSAGGHEIYYLTYQDKGEMPKMKNLHYVYLPFFFDRGNYRDKVTKTYMWLILAPLYTRLLNWKRGIDIIYCDDSVPYYGFFTKIVNPYTRTIIRLGDLQSGYSYADEKPWLYKLLLKMEVWMWDRMDGLVAISEPFKKFIAKNGIAMRKITVVEESINLDEIVSGLPGDEHVVMFHGSLAKCKGLEVLLEAFSIFHNNHPETRLIIAGGGEEERKLKMYVNQNKLKDVTFSGWYDHKKLEKIMKSTGISVAMRSPNIANNFVVTTCLLENWKFKKPVIAPDLECFRKIVVDRENGLLFKAGDAKDLASKLDYLYSNQRTWKGLGEHGYKTAKKYFYYKNIAKKMVKTLEQYI